MEYIAGGAVIGALARQFAPTLWRTIRKSKLADLSIEISIDFPGNRTTDDIPPRERQKIEQWITNYINEHTSRAVRKYGQFVYTKHGLAVKVSLVDKAAERKVKNLRTDQVQTDQFIARFDAVHRIPAWRSRPRSKLPAEHPTTVIDDRAVFVKAAALNEATKVDDNRPMTTLSNSRFADPHSTDDPFQYSTGNPFLPPPQLPQPTRSTVTNELTAAEAASQIQSTILLD